MTRDLAEIAARLTKAQREAVLRSEPVSRPGAPKGVLVLPIYRDAGAMSRSLVDAGLAGFSRWGAALNKHGKAVRELLKETNDDAA